MSAQPTTKCRPPHAVQYVMSCLPTEDKMSQNNSPCPSTPPNQSHECPVRRQKYHFVCSPIFCPQKQSHGNGNDKSSMRPIRMSATRAARVAHITPTSGRSRNQEKAREKVVDRARRTPQCTDPRRYTVARFRPARRRVAAFTCFVALLRR